MADLRPKIFIGSSKKAYPIAEQVKKNLSTNADCYLWQDENMWEVNLSTFDNLLRMVRYFDFGVFVASADDLTLTADDKLVIEPRDNVILEMALYLGALGRDKSFLLVQKDVKLPSDFNGIYMPRFEVTDDSITSACKEIESKIIEHYSLGHLSLYPTTALAIGYYKNFLEGIVDSIQNAQTLNIDGIDYSDFRFRVVMPSDLKGRIREKASLFYKKHNMVENALQTKYRKHPAWFHVDPKTAPNVYLYDMPSTLTGIDDAIEMVLQKNYVGRPAIQEIIETRELNNFRRVLQIQIDKSPYAKQVVEIIDEF